MYRNVPKNLFHNEWKCTEKAISKVIWEGKGTLDAILSQINKKIGDRFHFQWRLNCQLSNYVIDKVNGSRVQPSLFGEDQRPDRGDGGNRAYPGRASLNKLISKQNRCIGNIFFADSRESSDPNYYKLLDILKLDEIFELKIAMFTHKNS